VSYAVRQRTQEIEIRVALGATQLDAAALVLRDLLLATLGILLGLGGALALARSLRTLLYEVTPTGHARVRGGAAHGRGRWPRLCPRVARRTSPPWSLCGMSNPDNATDARWRRIRRFPTEGRSRRPGAPPSGLLPHGLLAVIANFLEDWRGKR
jgi:hypothetical protein